MNCPKCGRDPNVVGVTWNGWTDTSCKCRPGFNGGGHGPSNSIRDWNGKVRAYVAEVDRHAFACAVWSTFRGASR